MNIKKYLHECDLIPSITNATLTNITDNTEKGKIRKIYLKYNNVVCLRDSMSDRTLQDSVDLGVEEHDGVMCILGVLR